MTVCVWQFVVARAQEKVEEWRQQALVLSKASSNQDAVLQGALKIVEEFSQQLPVLAELSSPTLKHKHWRNIYKGQLISVLYVYSICCLIKSSINPSNAFIQHIIHGQSSSHVHKKEKILRESKLTR